jgi:predicted small lipoprotein YifL
MRSAAVSPSSFTERRRLLLAVLALLGLAACGKRGELRLPTPEELAEDEEDPSS